MEVSEVLARLGGVARKDQLARHVSDRALAAAVAGGSVDLMARGAYGLPAAASTHRAAQRLSATICGPSAAVEHGWELLRQPDLPWLAVPANRNVPAHRRRGVHLVRSPTRASVTPPVETVLECARRLPFVEALAVTDSALRHRTVDHDQLQLAAARLRGPGSPEARRVAAHANHLAMNPLESALRGLSLGVSGLRLVPQVPVTVEGLEIHPDLVDVEQRIVVEAEGWLDHGGPDQFAHDVWRYTALTVDRWRVVRFGHRAVTIQPDWVVGCLETSARTSRGGQNCRKCA